MLTDVYTNPEPGTGPSGSLPPPFDRLVTEQTLTEAQARAVLAALASEQLPDAESHSGLTSCGNRCPAR